MPESLHRVPSGASLANSFAQASQHRRARPQDLVTNTAEENRVPLRVEAERLHRRESKLGLRSIFGRNKGHEGDKSMTESTPPPPSRDGSISLRSHGIRASLAEFSWPYGSHTPRSDVSPPAPQPSLRSVSTTPNLKHQKSASTVRGQSVAPKASRGSLAAWDLPPLFQAYPQAIKHANLPACTMSPEAVLRLQTHKGSVSLRDGLTQSSLTLDLTEDSSGEQTGRPRRKHRGNPSGSSFRFDWTRKIYMLVTSGYLLQYAGEGTFDRRPEKILSLGRESAAFVSDVIPGRHWVLQVSSVTDEDGVATPHASSLLSRLPFRGAEKRHASNMLMVFENADDMENWITILRREIEVLGGKKNVSETGEPIPNDFVQPIRGRPSQRTFVRKDPNRFSQISSPDMSWDHSPISPTAAGHNAHLDAADTELVRERSFDDGSTASGFSQDGRQLDGLRDSANRLSFISSGQRTVVTSAGSSPACSPVRETFESVIPNDLPIQSPPPVPVQMREAHAEPLAQPRMRPNAAAIHVRRQSMQANNHLLEVGVVAAPESRPRSTNSNTWQPTVNSPDNAVAPTPILVTPNFSVPASKRFSMKPVSVEPSRPMPPPTLRMPPPKAPRRPPPSALSINSRPLSFVQDYPSPQLPPPNLEIIPLASVVSPASTVPNVSSMSPVGVQEAKNEEPRIEQPKMENIVEEPEHTQLPIRTPSLNHKQNTVQLTIRSNLRRQASAGSMRPGSSEEQQQQAPQLMTSRSLSRGSKEARAFLQQHYANANAVPVPRRPALDLHDPVRAPSIMLDSHHRSVFMSPAMPKTPSRFSLYGQAPPRPEPAPPLFDLENLPPRSRTPSLRPVSRTSPAHHHLRADSFNRNALQRRSMPQLVDGPPPAPPPTCALPPIPRKFSEGDSLRHAGFRT